MDPGGHGGGNSPLMRYMTFSYHSYIQLSKCVCWFGGRTECQMYILLRRTNAKGGRLGSFLFHCVQVMAKHTRSNVMGSSGHLRLDRPIKLWTVVLVVVVVVRSIIIVRTCAVGMGRIHQRIRILDGGSNDRILIIIGGRWNTVIHV